MDKEKPVMLAGTLRGLDRDLQRLFVEALFTRLTSKARLDWFKKFCYVIWPRSRWDKLDRWMERRFEKDPRIPPRGMAFMCMYYVGIDSKMIPFLVKLAQRVKRRVLARRRRRRCGGRKEVNDG